MTTPAITDFTLYTTTPLTNTDWTHNFQQVATYLTDGNYDFTINSLVTTGGITLNAGNLVVTPASNSAATFNVKNFAGTSILAVDTSNSKAICSNLTIGGANITPLATVILFAGSTAPTGWLICDGSAISRSTYADLFAIVGTTYGAGDTTTTFNIPDLRDKFAIGKSASKALGTTGGSTTIAEANLPAHLHTLTATEALHSHTSTATTAVGSGSPIGTTFVVTGSSQNKYANRTITNLESTSIDNGSLSGTTDNTGSGTAYNQPYQALNYIIRAL